MAIYSRSFAVKDKCYRYKYTRMEMKAVAKEGLYFEMLYHLGAYMWYNVVYFICKK